MPIKTWWTWYLSCVIASPNAMLLSEHHKSSASYLPSWAGQDLILVNVFLLNDKGKRGILSILGPSAAHCELSETRRAAEVGGEEGFSHGASSLSLPLGTLYAPPSIASPDAFWASAALLGAHTHEFIQQAHKRFTPGWRVKQLDS